MKKWLPISLLLCCVIVGGNDVYGKEQKSLEKESVKLLAKETQNVNQKEVTKEFKGRGDAEKDRQRQLRFLRYSKLEPIGRYAEKGDTLTVTVKGQRGLELVIGTHERNTQKNIPLTQGINRIKVENEGAIYISNSNEDGSSLVTISGATGEMPYFDLHTTSVEEFQKQMKEKTTAKDVQLVSNKAIITVSYEQAKKYLDNPKELMEYYDKFLLAQDRVSGIKDDGKTENAADRHFQHFVEVARKYMFATHEYMGFNGDAALVRLLKTDNGWGVWHESGHQRQQLPWKWESVTESSVNIYSMAAQKEITGSIIALDQHYSKMHAYLESKNKDFEEQSNELKMVMFGQLANTFGEDFYPILHQYYRENKLSYTTDADRIQNFVVNVSAVTGYNMVPYFEQWGFKITDTTKEKTNHFLVLPEKIWLNDAHTVKTLPMRFIESVSRSEKMVKINLMDYENDIFQGQKLVLKKNGIYVSELTNKKPFSSSLVNDVWTTYVALEPTDELLIEVRNAAGTFEIYKDALKHQLINYLGLGEEISTVLEQNLLDKYRNVITEVSDSGSKKELLELLEQVEQKYLASLVKDIRFDNQKNLLVEFSNDKFKEYDKIVITGTGTYIAEIAKGKGYYSTLFGNTLRITQNVFNQENFVIEFRLPHKTYVAKTVKYRELS